MNLSFRTINSTIHLWLGLLTAPLVFFICLTGTIIVFSDEIMELSAGQAKYVPEIKAEKLSTEQLLTMLHTKYPKRRVPGYMVSYRNPERSVRFNIYDPDKGLRMVYVDPYTGEVLKDDGTIYFFYVTAHLHNSLLLHKPGQWIVDIAVLIFLVELLSGLVIWWPKTWNKKTRKASFSVKWQASFKRINQDVHKVFGFYGLGICLLLTVTGLWIAFQPFAGFTKDIFGGDSSLALEEMLPRNDSSKVAIPVNVATNNAFTRFPEKNEIQVHTYRIKESGFYTMNVAGKIGLKSARSNVFLVIDKYTGEKIELPEKGEMNEKIENLFWNLHMGNWMGWTGKIMTFLGGLISTILPVTGFWIWWNKRSKNKKRRRQFLSQL